MDAPLKTPIGTAWIDADGIMWHRLDDGVRVSGPLARETVRVMARLLSERPAPAIVDITSISFADQEAREIFAQMGGEAPELATAILVRSQTNPAPSMLSFFFSRLETDRPVAFFDNEAAAVAWVRQHLDTASDETSGAARPPPPARVAEEE